MIKERTRERVRSRFWDCNDKNIFVQYCYATLCKLFNNAYALHLIVFKLKNFKKSTKVCLSVHKK